MNGVFAVCGIPESKFITTCSTVDKLDKVSVVLLGRSLPVSEGGCLGLSSVLAVLIIKRFTAAKPLVFVKDLGELLGLVKNKAWHFQWFLLTIPVRDADH